MKLQKNRILLVCFLIVIFLFFSFVSSYDSEWQNWRTKNDYVVCGGNYRSCSNSLLGLDWYKEIPNAPRRYGLICGESPGPYGCLLYGGAAIGKNFPLTNGNYYLIIKNYFDNTGYETGETFIAAISNGFEVGGRNGADLGGGYKSCVFKNTFSGNPSSQIWIKGNGNSFNSVNFRVSSCIPDENLVYCEDGTPAITNCQIQCALDIKNTSWSEWQNLGCINNLYRNQSRFRIEYDTNNCGTFQNKTYYEYRLVGPNYINTTWSNWENITFCRPNNTILQGRILVSYDTYSCAPNINYYEYREMPCSFNEEFFTNLSVKIISPQNNTFYNVSSIVINATSNQIISSWVYNLDNIGNKSFFPGDYLTNLTNGSHNLVVCGTNENGTACDFVIFYVNLTQQNEGRNILEEVKTKKRNTNKDFYYNSIQNNISYTDRIYQPEQKIELNEKFSEKKDSFDYLSFFIVIFLFAIILLIILILILLKW